MYWVIHRPDYGTGLDSFKLQAEITGPYQTWEEAHGFAYKLAHPDVKHAFLILSTKQMQQIKPVFDALKGAA